MYVYAPTYVPTNMNVKTFYFQFFHNKFFTCFALDPGGNLKKPSPHTKKKKKIKQQRKMCVDDDPSMNFKNFSRKNINQFCVLFVLFFWVFCFIVYRVNGPKSILCMFVGRHVFVSMCVLGADINGCRTLASNL